MPTPSEHKTIQTRILVYAEAVGWSFVSREEAEKRRGGIPAPLRKKDGDRNVPAPLSFFFDELLDTKVREFNPCYAEAEGALIEQFRHLHGDIYGNREFIGHLRNRGKFFDHEEKRERDLILIDYDDPSRNVYEVTEEWAFHNGHYGTREDVVFLINGIPVLVIECKNANKDEAIALGVDQIGRYHREPAELFVPEQLFTATDAIGFSYGVTWSTVRRNLVNWNLTEGGHSCPPLGNEGRGLESPLSIFNSQESPRSFFDAQGVIDVTTNHLPHWQQGQVWVFVTWRLGDSLPKTKLEQWKAEREVWMKHHPETWDEKTETEYHNRFSRQIDDWLDQGSGSCVLKEPACARIVADALRHFDGERYELASFVVMPNHVHVLFRPLGAHALPEIVKSWKGFTAREINQRIGKTGALWQDEYWDRLIRNQRHFFKVEQYIRENPAKAKLRDGQFLWEGGHSCPPFIEEDGGQREGDGGHECPPSVGNLEVKVKTFCAIPQVLAFLKDDIIFAERRRR
jgi:type I restriction enzyme R subunit